MSAKLSEIKDLMILTPKAFPAKGGKELPSSVVRRDAIKKQGEFKIELSVYKTASSFCEISSGGAFPSTNDMRIVEIINENLSDFLVVVE